MGDDSGGSRIESGPTQEQLNRERALFAQQQAALQAQLAQAQAAQAELDRQRAEAQKALEQERATIAGQAEARVAQTEAQRKAMQATGLPSAAPAAEARLQQIAAGAARLPILPSLKQTQIALPQSNVIGMGGQSNLMTAPELYYAKYAARFTS